MKASLQLIRSCCDIRGNCWLWRHGVDAKGGALARFDGVVRRVRRVVFELDRGVELASQKIGARCGTVRCVSPVCAFEGTLQEIHAISSRLGRYSTHYKALRIREGKARHSKIPTATVHAVRAASSTREAMQATGLSKSWCNRLRSGMGRNTAVDRV